MTILSCPSSAGYNTERYSMMQNPVFQVGFRVRQKSQNWHMEREMINIWLQLDIAIPNEISEMNGGE